MTFTLVEGPAASVVISARSGSMGQSPLFDNYILIWPGLSGEDDARMTKVFLCYRREDSADVTGRIHDRLAATFGAAQVMKDVDSIPLGVDFREHLDRMVAECDVFVAVVGRDWDTSRLNEPKDFCPD